jgi:2-hydroxychromene-2-carboxylate isomerase
MAKTKPSVRFHFDYLSHNAYLAWTQIHALAARHGRGVEPVPVVFGVLLKHYGQLGPAEVLPKAVWMIKNVLRKAARLGVPLEPMAAHPFNPLLALRVSSLDMDAESRRRVVDGLFRAVYVESRDVMEPGVVAQVATAAGLDGDAAVEAAGREEAKARLRAQTDAALAAGVFGVPTMIADGELFFGFDDFPNLESFLRGDDPLDRSALAAWLAPRPAFRRKEDPRRSAPPDREPSEGAG